MKKLLLSVFTLAALSGTENLNAQTTTHFIHKADTTNISGYTTALDHPDLNGNSSIYPIFTHNYNPGGGSGKYVIQKQSFWKSGATWKIYNDNFDAFKNNSNYNILLPGTDMESFVHTSDKGNTTSNRTYIDHPSINGDPNAIILVSSVYGVYNTNTFGVFYSGTQNKWAIYNQAGTNTAMGANKEFHVAIVKKNQTNYSSFVHTADTSNTVNNNTKLDHPYLNNNPNAIVHITQRYSTMVGNGVYNNHNVGVYYDGSKWAIFNEKDQVFDPMPNGAHFNVVFIDPTMGQKELTTSKDLFELYPNPAKENGSVNISLNNSANSLATVKVYNLNGQCLAHKTIDASNGDYELNTSNLHKGMYLITVENNGNVSSQKLLID